MPLHVKSTDVPEVKRVQSGEAGTGSMVVRKGYGNECSLMIATRAPGYHTKPHQHESEQINYVLDGEIWFFVEEKGFHCKKGDFQRIPANTIHWAWNRSDSEAMVAEAHAPGADRRTRRRICSGTVRRRRGRAGSRSGSQPVRPLRPGESRSQVRRQIACIRHASWVQKFI